MRIVRYHEYGGPEVLRVEEAPTPQPAAGEVLIRTGAIGVNFIDMLLRRGAGPWPTSLPGAPSGDVVGTVAALGDGVTSAAVGDRVVAHVMTGAYADYVTVAAGEVHPVPVGLGDTEASVLSSPGPVAVGVIRTGRLAPGETVLVHAAAGAIGHLAVQLARLAGAGTVIATASSPAKLAFAREYGADVAVDYTRPGWADEVRAATGGRGVDLILDSVGGEILRTGIGLLAPAGRLVVYGMASGERPETPAGWPRQSGPVTGFTMPEWTARHPDEVRSGQAELVGHLVTGRLRVALHSTLPLTEAAKAHELFESRAQIGRVLLLP